MATVLVACATSPHSSLHYLPDPPSEEQRAEFGRIGVVLEDTRTPPELASPGGEAGGAARGAAAGGLAVITVGAQAGPVGIIAGVFLSPFGLLVGGAYGALAAESAEAEAAARERIAAAFRARPPAPVLLEELVRCARTEAQRELHVLDERWAGEPTPAQLAAARAAGCDSVLVLRLDVIGLATADMDVDPSMTFELYSTARLLRLADGARLHELPLRWSSGAQTFVEWSAAEAADVRAALEEAPRASAERIVEELFLLHLESARAPSRTTEDADGSR